MESYTIKYEVHCLLENFFDKEIIIKNCMSELHAKTKLDNFCKKKYKEYQYIIVKSCKKDKSVLEDIMGGSGFNDIFGGKNFNNIFGGK